MSANTKTVLGVTIHAITMADALALSQQWLDGTQAHMVVTPNPEILLAASKDSVYQAVLNSADLSLPDGKGVQMLARLPERVTGVDFSTRLIETAAERGESVCFVVREDGRSSAEEVRETVEKQFPGAEITVLAVPLNNWNTDVILAELLECAPRIIVVGLGFPQQEQFLSTHLDHLPSARIGIGVGGTFDFWTGAAQRSPRWIQTLGFEWLYRLVKEPRRAGRIWRAVVVFPLTVLWSWVVPSRKK